MAEEPPRIGTAPIEEAYRQQMNELAAFIDEIFNGKGAVLMDQGKKKVGFCLMVFPFDSGPGRCNYISNANRDDIKVLLREQLAKFEGSPDQEGRA